MSKLDNKTQRVTAITLDSKTKKLLDDFAIIHSISRSSTIRLIVNDYFNRNHIIKKVKK